jgi:hypothetical protein
MAISPGIEAAARQTAVADELNRRADATESIQQVIVFN